jgi:hypothetical protein
VQPGVAGSSGDEGDIEDAQVARASHGFRVPVCTKLNTLEHVPMVRNQRVVMAGLVPAIHALTAARKTRMRGTSPRMTVERLDRNQL